MPRNAILWTVWILASLIASGGVAAMILVGGDRTSLLIGETTGAHHQFEVSCETCHAGGTLVSAKKMESELNAACRNCHDDELAESDDSHPRKKFRSPRMADYWERVDVRNCTSCHVEHRPEITRPGAVTLPMNYCIACHSEGERDVRVNRPSHAGLEYDTCASAGCHNFHDNRALYEDFLVKHAEQPWLADKPVHALTAKRRAAQPDASLALAAADAVAPDTALADTKAIAGWAESNHAAGGVNCGACHAAEAGKSPSAADVLANWSDAPDTASCAKCHRDQGKTFSMGRHGMRGHKEIATPRKADRQLAKLGLKDAMPDWVLGMLEDPAPPARMKVAEARVPMHAEAAHKTLGCGTCHDVHSVDTRRAAVEACAGCHADEHTKAYFDSPHYTLWQAELAGEGAPGTGVSCASCHMPKTETRDRVATNHNQNDVLRPNEKMIRPVCMDCHGLRFAIDALADADLVQRNFQGRTARHVESIDWAVRRVSEKKPDEDGDR
ncbi:MAG: ammonia-forming cytochrome c nitrite reductase subunit c552 [Minwuia sp.]|uniref:ammonia-forming cytochrome c nitrite reductase subunit c552 n=1 Tax=Minwuia sp. TaxID=2493630 RepID=UPI003A85B627